VLIDESSPDDNDYVIITPAGVTEYTDLYGLPDHTTEDGIISNVTVYARVYGDHNGDWIKKVVIKTHSTSYEENISGIDEWSNKSHSWNTNPNTSSAWTWSEIDALAVGLKFQFGKCSQLYVVVTYSNPTINTFTVNSATFTLGDKVTLTWTSTDATSASITPTVGSTTVNGTIDLYPTATTTYTLTVTDGVNSDDATVTATLNSPVIDSFDATPETIEFSKLSVLSWTTTGAATVSINQGIGTVSSDGSYTVVPTETTSYAISAQNSTATVYDYLTVTVVPVDNSAMKASIAKDTTPDYGRLPQMGNNKSYLEYSGEITEQYVRSIGYDFRGGEFKRPYISKDYNSMIYAFDDMPSDISMSIKETQIPRAIGSAPDKNDMFFDFSPQLASKENFNSYARENYRLMGKSEPVPTLRFAGVVESIGCDVDTHIPDKSKATLTVVSPKYTGDKYIWSGRSKDGTGEWGSFSTNIGLTTVYTAPTLTSNYRYVIISLNSGGKLLAELEFMVWFKG